MSYHKSHEPFYEVEASRSDFEADKPFSFVKTANPRWKAGDGLNDGPASKDFAPDGPFREVDPQTEDKGMVYKMMISAITPRPIALVSSMDEKGVTNLAPFSYFAPVNHNPPTICISVAGGGNGLKDTAANILAQQEFCVSIVSEPFIEAMNYSCIDAPLEVDEWALAGLNKRASKTIRTPHLAESAFSMECKLAHHYVMNDPVTGKQTGTVFLGTVQRFHVKESVLDKEDPGIRLMAEKLRAVGRLGGITYSRTIEGLELPRPVWDQVKDSPEVKAALERQDGPSRL